MTENPHPAFCLYRDFDPAPPSMVSFDRHYLMYSARGAVGLGVESRQWTLPPSYAAWIPAATEVEVSVTHTTTCCSVFYAPSFLPNTPTQTRVFAMTPVARDMIYHARRWPADAPDFSDHADAFFRALGHTCIELAAGPSAVWMPKGKTPPLQRALRFTEAHLAEPVEFGDVAKAAHLSERTLARRYEEETGMTWRQSLRRLRMIRAIELLSNKQDPIVQVALQVGYNSLSAFNKAFRDFAGTTPSKFRNRHHAG